MKKLFLLCLINILSLYAFSQITIAVQVSIENEYTQALESPLKYGLLPEDFKCKMIQKSSEEDWWEASFSQWITNDQYYLASLISHAEIEKEYEFIVTINKSGHKLNGLSNSFHSTLKGGVNSFIMESGWIIKIPQ